MTITTAPANTTYGTVTGRFLQMVGDSSDPDPVVDAVPARGKITFIAEAPYLIDVRRRSADHADPGPGRLHARRQTATWWTPTATPASSCWPPTARSTRSTSPTR